MTDEKLPTAARSRVSRRTVLKLTGAGAAIAWTTPIISSVRMPAFAASTPCNDPNPFTDTFESEGCGVPEPGLNNFAIVQGSVDIIGGSCGNQFVNTPSKVVDLSGTPAGGCAGSDSIIETAAFPAGTYQFQFDLGGSQRGALPNTVVVSFGTFAATPFTVASSDPLATLGPFTAVSNGADALRFDSASANPTNNCIGALLDNVIVRRCS